LSDLLIVGNGATGTVFKAPRHFFKDLRLPNKSSFALKVYKTDFSADNLRRERELRLGLALRHDHLIRTYALGEVHTRRKVFHPALLMEFYKGKSLDSIRGLALPEGKIARIGRDLASALELLHQRGIVHRDVKPHNTVLCRNGAVLLDLGVAKELGQPPASHSNEFLATLRYAAPEEYAEDAEPSPAWDIYGLGTVLYELASREELFRSAKNQATISGAVLDGIRWQYTYDVRQRLSAYVFELIRSMLALDPLRRPSVGDVIRTLATYAT